MEGHLDLLQLTLDSGPIVKAVLLSLIMASILSWGIVLNKWKTFNRVSKNNKEFLAMYQSGADLRTIMENSENMPFSPYKVMFTHGYRELTKLKEKYEITNRGSIREHFASYGISILERGLQRGMHIANSKNSKYLSTLASISSVTPFIGLLGTVWGIIDSFRGIATGGGSLDAVAPGIAEALIATAAGLAAAIPAVWFYNHYSNMNSSVNEDMESFGQDFLNLVERSVIEE